MTACQLIPNGVVIVYCNNSKNFVLQHLDQDQAASYYNKEFVSLSIP